MFWSFYWKGWVDLMYSVSLWGLWKCCGYWFLVILHEMLVDAGWHGTFVFLYLLVKVSCLLVVPLHGDVCMCLGWILGNFPCIQSVMVLLVAKLSLTLSDFFIVWLLVLVSLLFLLICFGARDYVLCHIFLCTLVWKLGKCPNFY